jgi:ADP-heptose:LPS heptosyltransferase
VRRRRVIAARSDSIGDVLLTGPAIRAIGTKADVVLLCGPRGLSAAEMLPGVSRVVCAELPWIDPEPQPVRRLRMLRLVDHLQQLDADEAVIFTSFHQSALPLALLLRMAGVRCISAISEDYPGSLLDVRHRDPGDVHEVERALGLAEAAGFSLPADDDASLRISDPGPPPAEVANLRPYVVVHPGASVPARMWPVESSQELVALLRDRGWNVVVTGGRDERELTAQVAGRRAMNLGARLSLSELASVIGGAETIVVPNTGPAHLAAAVGTPVVSLFSPVVSAARWRPWGVSHALLGDQTVSCARTRARVCPVDGHPCLTSVSPREVLAAVEELTRQKAAA